MSDRTINEHVDEMNKEIGNWLGLIGRNLNFESLLFATPNMGDFSEQDRIDILQMMSMVGSKVTGTTELFEQLKNKIENSSKSKMDDLINNS